MSEYIFTVLKRNNKLDVVVFLLLMSTKNKPFLFNTDCKIMSLRKIVRAILWQSLYKKRKTIAKTKFLQPKNNVLNLKTYFYEKFTKFWRSRVEC